MIVMVAGLTDLPSRGVHGSLYELTSLCFASGVAFFKAHLLYFRNIVYEEGRRKALAWGEDKKLHLLLSLLSMRGGRRRGLRKVQPMKTPGLLLLWRIWL